MRSFRVCGVVSCKMIDEHSIKKIISLRFRRLKKNYDKLDSFDIDVIHDFRVEYKRLRAFIRLLSAGATRKQLKLPSSLKQVYKKAGVIRDLQLNIENLKNLNNGPGAIKETLRAQKAGLAVAKRDLNKVIGSQLLNESKKEIEKQIPNRLGSDAIGEFSFSKLQEIKSILAAGIIRDDGLHQVRKNVKDILYNAKVFEKELSNRFPWTEWNANEERRFVKLAEILGNYQDITTMIGHLGEKGVARSTNESENIGVIRVNQQRLKKKMKRDLLNELSRIEIFQF